MKRAESSAALTTVLEALKASGRRGMLLADVQAMLGSSDRTAELLLQKLRQERNLIERRSDKEGKAQNRFRYFAKGFAPAIVNNPAKSKTAVPTKTKKLDANAPVVCNVVPIICPSGKDYRFTATGPVPRGIVSASECRPWAAVVAP